MLQGFGNLGRPVFRVEGTGIRVQGVNPEL